jgi:hypothetical protein
MTASVKNRPALLSTPLLPNPPSLPSSQANNLFDMKQTQYKNSQSNSFNLSQRPNNNVNNNKNKKGILNKINARRTKFNNNNNNKANKNNIKINKGNFYSPAQNSAQKKENASKVSPSVKFYLSSNSSTPNSSKKPSPNSSIQKGQMSSFESENVKLASFLSSAGDIDERFIDKTTARLDVDYRQANSNDNSIMENNW